MCRSAFTGDMRFACYGLVEQVVCLWSSASAPKYNYESWDAHIFKQWVPGQINESQGMHIFFNNESCDVSISINTNIYFLDVFSVCSDPLSLYNNVMQVNLVLFVCQIKFTLLKYVLYVSFFQSGWVQPLTTYQVRSKYQVNGTSLDERTQFEWHIY